MKKLVCVILSAALLFCLSSCGQKPKIRREIDNSKLLRVSEDGYLTDGSDNGIQLRGVNFGGWLLQETWMCPVMSLDRSLTVKGGTDDGWAELDTLNKFTLLFGEEKTAELFKSYRDNYITEEDFENVKALGFNCIRIPFWYRNFMSDENGTYITENDDENPGFVKLDFACEMAEKYNLYLIFDMHGCPGGQNGNHSSGKTGRNLLYSDKNYQVIMENLWIKIATRYKDRTCVAAYDVMNEPLNNADTEHGVLPENAADPWQDVTLRKAVYDRMIKAIRSADRDHIITVEALWRMDKLPDPSEMGWSNMMYQLHSYDKEKKTTKQLIRSMKKARRQYKVAVYMGEFNPTVFCGDAVSLMDSALISYTLWNYKTTSYKDSDWGLYNKSLAINDIAAMASSEEAKNKILAESGQKIPSLENLSPQELYELYEKLWSKENLVTSSYKLNGKTVGIFSCPSSGVIGADNG